MVLLHIKKGDESQFLYQAHIHDKIDKLTNDITIIYNGRLKVSRIIYEMEELVKYGTLLPYEMQGLTDEQIEELKLKDKWGDECVPSGGYTFEKDPIGRRNGHKPSEKMQEILNKTMTEAKHMISKKQVEMGKSLSQKTIHDALSILRGAIMIVYPMGLPPHDPIRRELENTEDLTGTQAQNEVIECQESQLWFCGKELLTEKKLSDFAGNNDKSKLIIKIQKRGGGVPGREPIMTEEERKAWMLHSFRRQEELKKLDKEDSNDYLNSKWADSGELQRQFHGLKNISWRPK